MIIWCSASAFPREAGRLVLDALPRGYRTGPDAGENLDKFSHDESHAVAIHAYRPIGLLGAGECPGELAQSLGLGAGRGARISSARAVGVGDRTRSADQPTGATGNESWGEMLDAPSLRADPWEQEHGVGHQLTGACDVLGRGCADDRTHVTEALLAEASTPQLVYEHGDSLPNVLATGQLEILDLGGAGV
jgi:hypothetical protein